MSYISAVCLGLFYLKKNVCESCIFTLFVERELSVSEQLPDPMQTSTIARREVSVSGPGVSHSAGQAVGLSGPVLLWALPMSYCTCVYTHQDLTKTHTHQLITHTRQFD